jgi:hypothetical protein
MNPCNDGQDYPNALYIDQCWLKKAINKLSATDREHMHRFGQTCGGEGYEWDQRMWAEVRRLEAKANTSEPKDGFYTNVFLLDAKSAEEAMTMAARIPGFQPSPGTAHIEKGWSYGPDDDCWVVSGYETGELKEVPGLRYFTQRHGESYPDMT